MTSVPSQITSRSYGVHGFEIWYNLGCERIVWQKTQTRGMRVQDTPNNPLSHGIEKLPEGDLMHLYAQGHPQAAKVLTERIAPRILAFSARLLGGDRAEAEDITQEVMLRLWKAAITWERDGAAQPTTWAIRVASRLCIDRHRKARRTTTDLDAAPDPVDPAPGAEDRLQHAIRLSALDQALALLPERQRLAVILRHIEGWRNPDIAAHMEITVEAVESLTARGKRALTAALAPKKKELGYV